MQTTATSRFRFFYNNGRALCLAAAVAVAGLASASGARAEGLYIGGNLGTPHYSDSLNGVRSGGNGASGKLYGGYGFSPYFGIEAGYADLGHVNDTTGRNKAHGEFVDAVGTVPLNEQWSLLGRVGVTRVKLSTPLGSDTGTGVKVGLGGQYALTKTTALRAEWERYRTDVFNTKPNIDQYTLGVRVSF